MTIMCPASENERPPRSWPSVAVPCALLVATMAVALFLRFHNLTENGLLGSDTIYYTDIAKDWSEGTQIYSIPPGGGVRAYRPVSYLFFSAAIKWLGYNDYAIKFMNASLDSLNIVLLFAVCYVLGGEQVYPATAAAVFYALLPKAISFSRMELTHVSSVLMVLLTLLSFVLALRSKSSNGRHALMVVSGFCAGMAALTHEELCLLVPGYLLFLWSGGWQRTKAKGLCVDTVVYSFAALLACHGMLLATVGRPNPLESRASALERVAALPERCARLTWNGIVVMSSASFLYLFVILGVCAVGGAALRLVQQKRRDLSNCPLVYLPLTVSMVYAAGCAYFLVLYPARAFFAVLPLVLVSVVLWYWRSLERRLPRRTAGRLVMATTLGLIPLNIGNYVGSGGRQTARFGAAWAPAPLSRDVKVAAGVRQLWQEIEAKSWARSIYEQLGDNVRKDAKLLVAPSIIYAWPGRRALQVEYYFGDNAIYMVDHTEPLAELVVERQIKYVLFANTHLEKELLRRKTYTQYAYGGRWREGQPLRLGASYGFRPGEYSVTREYQHLMAYLKDRQATVVTASGRYVRSGSEGTDTGSRRWNYVVYALP
jgi:hypothetical protein